MEEELHLLAPEPTFYGIICVFLAIINQLCFRNEKYYKWILLACLFQIFVISRSSACIFVITISLVAYIVYQVFCSNTHRDRYILLFNGDNRMYSCLFAIDLSLLAPYRIGKLLIILQRDPMLFLATDASVNERFNHAFFLYMAF